MVDQQDNGAAQIANEMLGLRETFIKLKSERDSLYEQLSKNQSIFDYKSADKRFITFADQLYNFNDVVFQRCKLSESFRLTREISSFINTCMLRENRIISNKTSGKKPKPSLWGFG